MFGFMFDISLLIIRSRVMKNRENERVMSKEFLKIN